MIDQMKWKTEETISIAKWKDGNHFQCYYNSKNPEIGIKKTMKTIREDYVENM